MAGLTQEERVKLASKAGKRSGKVRSMKIRADARKGLLAGS